MAATINGEGAAINDKGTTINFNGPPINLNLFNGINTHAQTYERMHAHTHKFSQ